MSSAPSRTSQVSRQAKKEDDDDQPLLQVNNMKSQRFIDEQKLRVIQFSFSITFDIFPQKLFSHRVSMMILVLYNPPTQKQLEQKPNIYFSRRYMLLKSVLWEYLSKLNNYKMQP